MKLYYFPVAPNPTKVRTYLAEKGLEVPCERVDLRAGEHRTPEFLAKSPLGKLPVLEADDGSFLTESLAIIEYFEELHPDPPMIGTTPLERAHARSLERLAEFGVLVPVARAVHATNSPLGLSPNPAVAQQAREMLEQALGVLDARIGDGPFVAGARVTVADCTLRAAFGFAEVFKVEIPSRFENVASWYARFLERPSATLPF